MFKTEEVEEEYCQGNTKILRKRNIEYLESIENQDLNDWIEKFEKTSVLCKWSENDTLEVLRSLIRLNLSTDKEGEQNTEQIFNKLRDVWYPRTDFVFYLNKLKRINQKDFYWIDDYLSEIKALVHKLGACSNMTKKDINARIEETFECGLSVDTKMDMARAHCDKFEEKLCHIRKVENIIKEYISENRDARASLNSMNRGTSNRNLKPAPNVSERNNIWCKLCKTSRHDYKFCWKRKPKQTSKVNSSSVENYNLNSDSQNKNDKGGKNYFIKKTENSYEPAAVYALCNNTPIKAIIDTGSSENLISRKFADKYKENC